MNRAVGILVLVASASAAQAAAVDERVPVPVTEPTRLLVLAEMRDYVEALSAITGALARGDMAAVAEAAERRGVVVMQQFPRERMMELPEQFRGLGRSVHEDFDALAAQARGGGEVAQSLSRLSQTLAKCAGCHASYRLEAKH